MSLYVLTVSTPTYPTGMDWYFDVEHEFYQALSLVQRLGVSHGYQTDYATDFSEFQTWLQTQIKTNDP